MHKKWGCFIYQTCTFNGQFIIAIVKEEVSESCLFMFLFALNRILFHHISLQSTITLAAKFNLSTVFNPIMNGGTSPEYQC